MQSCQEIFFLGVFAVVKVGQKAAVAGAPLCSGRGLAVTAQLPQNDGYKYIDK